MPTRHTRKRLGRRTWFKSKVKANQRDIFFIKIHLFFIKVPLGTGKANQLPRYRNIEDTIEASSLSKTRRKHHSSPLEYSDLGTIPVQDHCVVSCVLGKIFFSCSASLHPDVFMGTGELQGQPDRILGRVTSIEQIQGEQQCYASSRFNATETGVQRQQMWVTMLVKSQLTSSMITAKKIRRKILLLLKYNLAGSEPFNLGKYPDVCCHQGNFRFKISKETLKLPPYLRYGPYLSVEIQADH